jgi:LysM repeat protein
MRHRSVLTVLALAVPFVAACSSARQSKDTIAPLPTVGQTSTTESPTISSDASPSSPTSPATVTTIVPASDVQTVPPTTVVPTTPTYVTLAPQPTTTVGAPPSSNQVATSTTVGADASGTYTVKAGDYLVAIARRVGTTADAIVAANGWDDGLQHTIYPGDQIKLPAKQSD